MTDDIDQTNRKLKNLERLSLEKNQSKEIMLPNWPDTKRGTPNSFLRSALFSTGDCKKDRDQLKDKMLASQQGISVFYSGEQLNQADLTLWETLVHLAKEYHLENICYFTGYEILKTLKLADTGENYKRLNRDIMRMASAVVTIRHDGVIFTGHLIDSALHDEATSHYKIRLGRELNKLYNQHTRIDAVERYQLKNKSLSQFLHGYYSSHKSPYPVKIDTLHQLSGSKIKAMWKFKQHLKKSLEDLIYIGFIESYLLEEELVTIKRI